MFFMFSYCYKNMNFSLWIATWKKKLFYLTFIGGNFTRSLVLTLPNVNWVGFKYDGIDFCRWFNFGDASPSETILL